MREVDGGPLERNHPVHQVHSDRRLHFDVNTLKGVTHPRHTVRVSDGFHHGPWAFKRDRALVAALDGEFGVSAVSGGHLAFQQEHHFAVVQGQVVFTVACEVNGFKATQARACKARHVQVHAVALELQGVRASATVDQDEIEFGD